MISIIAYWPRQTKYASPNKNSAKPYCMVDWLAKVCIDPIELSTIHVYSINVYEVMSCFPVLVDLCYPCPHILQGYLTGTWGYSEGYDYMPCRNTIRTASKDQQNQAKKYVHISWDIQASLIQTSLLAVYRILKDHDVPERSLNSIMC